MQPWTKNVDDALQLRGNLLLLHNRVGMRPADALARGGSNERVSRGIMGNRGVCVRVFFACANEWGQLVPAPALRGDTDRNVMEKVLCRYFSYISPKEERSQVIRHPFFARCFCKKQEMICREKSMRGSCSGRVVKLLRKSKQKHRLQKKRFARWVGGTCYSIFQENRWA